MSLNLKCLEAPKFWYKKHHPFSYFLYPISLLYLFAVNTRRLLYKLKIKSVTKFPIPIIVVGNISVGGTGKTPLVIWLAESLRSKGLKPGIVSRGYGSNAPQYPYRVTAKSSAIEAGDEALLIAMRTNCPVFIAPKRVDAVQELLNKTDCNVVISDDGLQHYALGRDMEIVIVDGSRYFGNGFCLPAGPLRESTKRLQSADLILVTDDGTKASAPEKLANSHPISFKFSRLYNLANPKLEIDLTEFKNRRVHAIAGIGNPARFFNMLRYNGIEVIEHPFPDHYPYKETDLHFGDDLPILLTEKDGVKCQNFAKDNYWCVAITAEVPAKVSSIISYQVGRIIKPDKI